VRGDEAELYPATVKPVEGLLLVNEEDTGGVSVQDILQLNKMRVYS